MSSQSQLLRAAAQRHAQLVGPKTPSAEFEMALLDRAHQQAAVAALGQAALTGVDFSTLLEQAAGFIAQTLSIDFASIFQLAPDQQTLRMTGGFGWNMGLVGTAEVSATGRSMAAYVLESREPVIVRDLRKISAFEIPEFARAHGVISSLSLVIPGHPVPWGIVEAQCRSGRSFNEDDFHFLQSIANILSAAFARKESEVQREHLAAFVEHNPNPVVELNDAGELVYSNDAARITAAALHRHSPVELLPPNVLEIIGRCVSSQTNLLNMEGEVGGRAFSWSFFPVARTNRVHVYGNDVTDQASLEAQLRQSQKMEAIGQLAAGVAHDFNNILTIMQGLLRRLGSEASPGQGPMLEQLFETTERAAGLTRQLLAFSRRQVLQRRVLSLNEVVGNMSRLLERLIGENIQLSVERDLTLPAVEADASAMEQIIMNLAVNARDAMPRGGRLVIATDTLDREAGGQLQHWVRLRVKDTGCGISPEVKAHIFEPFFTTKELGKGTGLGLATVFGIVKQHEGHIEVESAVGRGTTFTILLPACEKPLEATTQFIARTAVQPGAGETILLVEDEPLLRELAQTILTEGGYKVLEAERGEEALAIWREHSTSIDLLLTDMMLPGGMTGRELATELKKLKPNLRIIYSTGYSQDLIEPHEESHQLLPKPYPPEALVRSVRSCLDKKG